MNRLAACQETISKSAQTHERKTLTDEQVPLRGLLFQLLQLSLCDYFIIFHLPFFIFENMKSNHLASVR